MAAALDVEYSYGDKSYANCSYELVL
jgi:hypothetical protein